MLPIVLIAILLSGSLLTFVPMRERSLRNLGTSFIVISAALAVVIAWPGFTQSEIFGPADIWYRDGISSLITVLIAVISVSFAVVSHRYLAHEFQDNITSITDARHYYAMTPVFIASMYAATLTNNIGLMWVAIEATTLSTTLLVAFYRKRSAVEAAWKYVLLCSIGISLGLVGILLTTYAAGQEGINSSLLLSVFRDIAASGQMNADLMRWAFVFLFIGLGTKVGFVPMHAWLPDAHSKTPSPVSALLSGILLNVALLALLRFKLVADLAIADEGAWTGNFFLVFGVFSIVLPAMIILVQKNYKRLLAYSSIEHMGIMAFAIGLGPAGVIPAIMTILGHALAKSGLFLVAGEVFLSYKTTDSRSIKGVFLRLPKTAMLFMLMLLTLLPVPPSAMFVGELFMLGLGLRNHLWLTLLVGLALTIVFVGMLKHMYVLLYVSNNDSIASTDSDTAVAVVERWNVTHVVVIVHLILIWALGIYMLTPAGLQFVAELAQSINPGLL
jgi:hydrogenase-4 component F